ncbi:universal stress protein [Streptomyces sp. NBC_01707]|uniref:universal stress protein n=1 Tax=Streptomyces sp. NBC_01707 TaxID=2975914 RepID=UPI00352CA62A
MSVEEASSARIVVGIDGSEPSKVALRWAVRQAELTAASVEAVTVWEMPFTWYGIPFAPDRTPYIERAGTLLHEAIDAAIGPEHPVEIRCRVLEGNPAGALVDTSRSAEILVVGNRGHGGFSEALLGSVGQHCVHYATCPVVVVRGPKAAEMTVGISPPGRIVVGVDGSHSSKAALRWAVDQARLRRGIVDVVIAWQYPPAYGMSDALVTGDFDRLAAQVLRESIDEVVGPEPPVEIRESKQFGNTVQVLLDKAQGAELLVVGNRGHGGFAEALLGSVSQHCVHHATCPVVILRDDVNSRPPVTVEPNGP